MKKMKEFKELPSPTTHRPSFDFSNIMKTKITKIELIPKGQPIPDNKRLLKGWEAEKLIEENFEIFKDLKVHEYYKLDDNRYFWLGRFLNGSDIVGYGRYLSGDDWARGMLVVDK